MSVNHWAAILLYNLQAYSGLDLLILSGKHDEYNEDGEVTWLFDQIASDRKELVFFDSPHQLPRDHWMAKVVEWITVKRNPPQLTSK